MRDNMNQRLLTLLDDVGPNASGLLPMTPSKVGPNSGSQWNDVFRPNSGPSRDDRLRDSTDDRPRIEVREGVAGD